MLTFYTEEIALRFKNRAAIAGYAILALMIVSLILSVSACFFVNTRNAETLLSYIIALCVLSGWAELFMNVFWRKPARAESLHMLSVIKEETSFFEGEIRVSPRVFSIPKSIDVCAVSVLEGDGTTHSFHMNAGLRRKLPKNGTRVILSVQRGFVTGIEVAK